MTANQNKQKSVPERIIIKWENAKVKRSLKSNLRKKDIPYEGTMIRLPGKLETTFKLSWIWMAQLTSSIDRVLVKVLMLRPTGEARAAVREWGRSTRTIGGRHQDAALRADRGAGRWQVGRTPLEDASQQLQRRKMTRLLGKRSPSSPALPYICLCAFEFSFECVGYLFK